MNGHAWYSSPNQKWDNVALFRGGPDRVVKGTPPIGHNSEQCIWCQEKCMPKVYIHADSWPMANGWLTGKRAGKNKIRIVF